MSQRDWWTNHTMDVEEKKGVRNQIDWAIE